MANKLKGSQLKYLCISEKYFKLKAAKLSIYVLMTNKLQNGQLTYLLIRIILTLFEELYNNTGFAVYFSNL